MQLAGLRSFLVSIEIDLFFGPVSCLYTLKNVGLRTALAEVARRGAAIDLLVLLRPILRTARVKVPLDGIEFLSLRSAGFLVTLYLKMASKSTVSR